MIATRTLVSAGIAGLGTLTAGALIANEPKPSWENQALSKPRMAALGIGMGSMYGGIFGALSGPGRSLRPLMGVLAAGVGGMMLGQHVVGRLFAD